MYRITNSTMGLAQQNWQGSKTVNVFHKSLSKSLLCTSQKLQRYTINLRVYQTLATFHDYSCVLLLQINILNQPLLISCFSVGIANWRNETFIVLKSECTICSLLLNLFVISLICCLHDMSCEILIKKTRKFLPCTSFPYFF